MLGIDPTQAGGVQVACGLDRQRNKTVAVGAMQLAAPSCCSLGEHAAGHKASKPFVPSVAGRTEGRGMTQRANLLAPRKMIWPQRQPK
jgi:hypothetical protein